MTSLVDPHYFYTNPTDPAPPITTASPLPWLDDFKTNQFKSYGLSYNRFATSYNRFAQTLGYWFIVLVGDYYALSYI